ncbi:uncharacterized protein LOC112049006 [Bicyclus anynana]|uniref:Uncharacterized protein LOC112049006 n=1 Tax=Bicyclus anynana TaxID=110368 RepID=A0ABM3LXG4_BICAN|nr:uncharacterized protein LOC112049006 [Bicyclus anynana]
MNIILCLVGVISIIEGVVLDPALYLSPSPPLTTTHNNKAEEIWSQTVQSKIQEAKKTTSSIEENTDKTSTEPSEAMEPAETFWRSYRPTSLKGIHIPLTFHLTGAYGGNSGTGVLTSGYMSLADSNGNRGNAGLAGSGYRSYGTRPGVRVYGNDAKPAWGGWGNGKWGHYGKG